MAIRIGNFTTVRPEMSNTRTYEDFSKFLGGITPRLNSVNCWNPSNAYIVSGESAGKQ